MNQHVHTVALTLLASIAAAAGASVAFAVPNTPVGSATPPSATAVTQTPIPPATTTLSPTPTTTASLSPAPATTRPTQLPATTPNPPQTGSGIAKGSARPGNWFALAGGAAIILIGALGGWLALRRR